MRLSLSSVSLSQYGMPDLVNRLTLFSSALITTNTSFLAGTDTETVDAFELKVSWEAWLAAADDLELSGVFFVLLNLGVKQRFFSY